MSDRFDIAVLGGGPAGFAAARAALGAGCSVVLFDEQIGLGGQIWRGAEGDIDRLAKIDPTYRRIRKEIDALEAEGAHIMRGTAVWSLEDDVLCWFRDGEAGETRATRFILCAGAMERPFPVTGWTLPGVMTAGAAQIMLKTDGARPAGRVVLAGTGPLLPLVADQIAAAGAQIDAVLETSPSGAALRALRHLPEALLGSSYLRRGLKMRTALRRRSLRFLRNIATLEILGHDRVEGVRFARPGGAAEEVAADLVLLHQGVVPNVQLSRAIGLAHVWDEDQLCWRPELTAERRSSREDIFIAGDAGGIDGAASAELTGALAGLAAAGDLGYSADLAQRARLRRKYRHDRRVRPFIEALFRPRDAHRVPSDDTVTICRCEEVSAGEIRRCVGMGATGPNQLKAFTRAGMGPCQGRMCGLTVTELIAAERGVSPTEVGAARVRPPIKPLELGVLARRAGRTEVPPDGGVQQPTTTEEV